FKTPDDVPEVRRLVLDDLPRTGLVDIGRPVWTFDRTGRVQHGDPRQNAEPKWTYATGLDALGKRLAAGLDVRRAAGVARGQRRHAGEPAPLLRPREHGPRPRRLLAGHRE